LQPLQILPLPRDPVGLLHGLALAWRGVSGDSPALWRAYALWAVGLALLYPACRAFEGLKSRHRGAWWTHLPVWRKPRTAAAASAARSEKDFARG